MKTVFNFFNQSLIKVPGVFGAITSILCFFYFLALYAVGITPLGNKKILDFGIHIIMMVAAVWYYRKYVGHGMLHLWEALSICYVLNTFAAILTGWFIYGFLTYGDPAVFTNYLAEMNQLIVSTKGQLIKELGQAEYQKMLADVANIKPADLISDELAKKTVLAIFPALVISLIFRKQDYGVFQQ
ncbi:MAG: DUF4199 domain-containing protein [Runella slithyformis]|nr:MAG: DUF4199 domain-containing protein [Runella slithyformis]